MLTTIALREIEFFAFHGYYAAEQKMGNRFLVDVWVEINDFDKLSDTIGDTINYENLFEIVKTEMEVTEKLLETVVLKIIHRIKEQYSNVICGGVRLSKLGPQLGGKVGRAEIEMKF